MNINNGNSYVQINTWLLKLCDSYNGSNGKIIPEFEILIAII